MTVSLRRRTALTGGALAMGVAALLAPVDGVGSATAAPVPDSSLPSAPIAAPGTEGLTPQLALAYTLAHREATAAGVGMHIVSGKRSSAEQQALWREQLAISGNPEAARQWVLPPAESTHVTGEAIDVGPRAGADWLGVHGHRWGLCRSFANEWWHFEVGTVPGAPCPAPAPHPGVR